VNCGLCVNCFITKTEVLFFLICALDSNFWERIPSLNSHVEGACGRRGAKALKFSLIKIQEVGYKDCIG
jgi:hypothetical protein